MPVRPIQVLLATANELQRARVGSALLRDGYAVREAESVDDARTALGQSPPVDFIVSDLALPGGGAFTLARGQRAEAPPVIGLSDRQVDGEVRNRARTCGIEVVIEPPIFTGRVAAALAQVAAGTLSASGGGLMRGSLAQWSLADLLALAAAHRLNGTLWLAGPHGEVQIPLQEGDPVSPGGVGDALDWTAGFFELSRSAPEAAEPIAPEAGEPLAPPETDPDVGVSVAGRTYRRKLSLTPIAAEPPEELAPIEVVDQRRRRSQYGLTAATAASIIAAALLLWWATSSPERPVEVRVLDDVQESRPR